MIESTVRTSSTGPEVNADQLPSEPNWPPNATGRVRRRARGELLKRGLFGAAVLATLVALTFGLDRWHAKRTLVEWMREQESRGERFDPASVIPPPVPDDQNMLATSLFMDRFEIWRALASIPQEDRDGPPPLLNLWRWDGLHRPGVGSGLESGRRIDLAAWQEYYRLPLTSKPSRMHCSPSISSNIIAAPYAAIALSTRSLNCRKPSNGIRPTRTSVSRNWTRTSGPPFDPGSNVSPKGGSTGTLWLAFGCTR